MSRVEAVVFDLDGVIVDSEHVWDEVREELARERGGRWHERAQADMMGMSSPEWSRYMHDVIGLSESPEEINDLRSSSGCSSATPSSSHSSKARSTPCGDSAEAFRLALASSSNRRVIDAVLVRSGLAASFEVTVSSEEVAHGKPAPDVFLEAARRLGLPPERCARSRTRGTASAQHMLPGMRVIAIPNRRYPPPEDALAKADVVLASIDALDASAIQ